MIFNTEALTTDAIISPIPAALLVAGSIAVAPAVTTPSPTPVPLSTSNTTDVPAASVIVMVVSSFVLSVNVQVAVAATGASELITAPVLSARSYHHGQFLN